MCYDNSIIHIGALFQKGVCDLAEKRKDRNGRVLKTGENQRKNGTYEWPMPLRWGSQLEMSRNVQSGNTQNLKSTVIQRSFPKWSVAERRKTAAASDQAAVCACAHSRYFTGGSPSGLRV